MILRTSDQIEVILGETREVRVDVRNGKTPVFTIENPVWQLIGRKSKVIDQEAECEVEDEDKHTLVARITPTKRGLYDLIYTFKIAKETIKIRVEVRVS